MTIEFNKITNDRYSAKFENIQPDNILDSVDLPNLDKDIFSVVSNDIFKLKVLERIIASEFNKKHSNVFLEEDGVFIIVNLRDRNVAISLTTLKGVDKIITGTIELNNIQIK